MNHANSMASSEALFGSAARRDADVYSDIDYLLVDDDIDVLRTRKRCLAARGFSVSDYTWRRLGKAFESQTLFAMHLQREARLVVDWQDRLAHVFQSFRPKQSYKSEYLQSLELLRPLRSIPSTPRGRAWALDVLAVAFRNSAILTLANDGEYVFANERLVDAVRRRTRIKDDDVIVLRQLRTYKARYRASSDASASQADLDAALRAVGSALGVDFSAGMHAAGSVRLCGEGSTMAYASMRSLEAELITVPTRIFLDEDARRHYRLLSRCVRDPHSYLWQFMGGHQAHVESIARLREHY